MTKITNILTILIVVVFTWATTGCNINSSQEGGSEDSSKEDEIEEVVKNAKNPMFGEWRYTENVQGNEVVVMLTLNEDGTYQTMMNEFPSEGTWEFDVDDHIRVKSETIQDDAGQLWHIVNANKDELHINWNVKSGGQNVLVFNRVK
jgi:hypothetical protein